MTHNNTTYTEQKKKKLGINFVCNLIKIKFLRATMKIKPSNIKRQPH